VEQHLVPLMRGAVPPENSWRVSGQKPVKGWLSGNEEDLSAVSRASRPNVLSLRRAWSLWPGHTKTAVGYQDHKSVQPQGGPPSAETQEPYQDGVSKADTEEQCSGSTYQECANRGALESQPLRKRHQEKAQHRNAAVEREDAGLPIIPGHLGKQCLRE